MNDVAKIEIKKLEQEFVAELQAGLEGIAKAGCILVKLIDADQEAITRLTTVYKIPRSTLTTLAMIGNKQLCPELAFAESRMRALPMPEQKRIIAGPVEVLVVKSDGSHDTLMVNLITAPQEIKNQVLNSDHIRTLEDQRAYLVSQQNRKQSVNAAPEKMPWQTYGQHRIKIGDHVFSRSDLLSMLKAIEG